MSSSVPYQIASGLASYINELELTTTTCEAVLLDTFEPTEQLSVRFTVQPISLQTYRECRDILREKSAYVVTYTCFADATIAEDALNLLYNVQSELATGVYIPVKTSGVVIDETRFNSAIEVEKGSEFDGYYNSTQLEESNVFKSSFIVVVSRRLKIGSSLSVS